MFVFFFGVRASELSAIHRDYHPDKSCVDMDNSLLHIRGTIRHHSIKIKLKIEDQKEQFLLMKNGLKFLEMWTYYLDGLGKDNKYLLPGKNGGPLCYKYYTWFNVENLC